MKLVKITITEAAAKILRQNQLSRLGSDRNVNGFNSLVNMKRGLQNAIATNAPVETVFDRYLPEWAGDINERAAVAVGLSKKHANKIVSVVEI